MIWTVLDFRTPSLFTLTTSQSNDVQGLLYHTSFSSKQTGHNMESCTIFNWVNATYTSPRPDQVVIRGRNLLKCNNKIIIFLEFIIVRISQFTCGQNSLDILKGTVLNFFRQFLIVHEVSGLLLMLQKLISFFFFSEVNHLPKTFTKCPKIGEPPQKSK